MSQKQAALKWVLKLKQGTYRKITGVLKQSTKVGGKYGYCCLGVGCAVNKIDMSYSDLLKTVGLKNTYGYFKASSLVHLNDEVFRNDKNHKNIFKRMKEENFSMFVPEVQEYLIKNT